MSSSELQVDRRLPDSGTVRQELTVAGDLVVDEFDELQSITRLLYPVYRLKYSYVVEATFPWGSDTTNHDVCLVDGLWAGNSGSLQSYVASARDPETVDPAEQYDDVRTHLLEFQLTNGQVSSMLESQLSADESADSQDRLDPRDDTPVRETTPGQGGSRVGLPMGSLAVGQDGNHRFSSVESIERLYIPFWVAKFTTESHDRPYFLSFRDVGDDVGRQRIDTHPWLAEFTTDHPELVTDALRENWLDTPVETNTASGVAKESTEPTVPPDSTLDAGEIFDANPERSFDDVAGMNGLKSRLRHRVIEPTLHPERFADYGLGTVDGVLLHGPPGCGKTYISGALAGELGIDFIRVTPALLTSKYTGEPAQKVADLFEIARLNQPCLVFIDEIDAIAGQRSDDRMNTSEQQLVNQLLTELEAVSDEEIIVLAATNRIEDVDGAIRRSGRFDERIEVPPPDATARRKILSLHLAGRPTAPALSLDTIVDETAGYAASDLELLVETAARRALRDEAKIADEHLQTALSETETSIGDWTDSYPGLFAEVDDYETVVRPEGVDMNANAVVEPNPRRTFDDVGGLQDITSTLRTRIIEPLERADEYAEYGLDTVDGVLLYGPPGCGKTYVTEALAGELGYHFLPIRPADIASKWMGQPAQNVADLFTIARANQPCLVFVDELDALAGDRTGDMNTSEQQLVNQLLVELEAVAEEDVVVVGATNLPSDIDPALRRSGRFDERIEVTPPGPDARQEILAVHLEDRPRRADIDWEPIVESTAGYAASDLELLVENATRRAFREDDPVGQAHLEAAAAETQSSLSGWDDRDRYEDDDQTESLRYIG